MQTKGDIPRIMGNPDDWEGCEELGPASELMENYMTPTTRATKRRMAREIRSDLKKEAKRRSRQSNVEKLMGALRPFALYAENKDMSFTEEELDKFCDRALVVMREVGHGRP